MASLAAAAAVAVVEDEVLTPAKRRRVRAAATSRRLWHRTRWEAELVCDVENEDKQEISDLISQVVQAEVSKALVLAEPALMRKFGLAFKQMLKEEFVSKPEVAELHGGLVDCVAALDKRVVAVEARPLQDNGPRRRFDMLCKRVAEVERELRDLDDRMDSLDEATGVCTGAAGDLRAYSEEDEDVDEGIRSEEALYEGAYVMVHDVEGRAELTGTMGVLKEPCDAGWVVRLRMEELVVLKANNVRLLNG